MDDYEADGFPPEFASLHLDEIEELLAELGLELESDELHQAALFLRQSGSLEAALHALAELDRKAA